MSPSHLVLPIPLLVIFFVVYSLAAPYFRTEKQRAFILSTLSSAMMTLVSLPFVWNYVTLGLDVSYHKAQDGWLREVAMIGITFFGTYLTGEYLASTELKLTITPADLAIGHFKYPSQVDLLTGWIHHTCYIILMALLTRSPHFPIFLTAGCMELPTFDLAISNLFPQMRNDLRFLSTFFFVRILFHAVLLLNCIRASSRLATNDSWLPTILLTLAGILHVMWFRGGVKGYIRRQRASRNGHASANTVKERVIDTAGEVHPMVNETVPTTPKSQPTPEDSPIVTPYTPSQTPMSLRDSYLFPTLSLPIMPNLSVMSIPTIPSLSDITAALPKSLNADIPNFGFRDAVKIRWDEQRGKLADIGTRGRGMAIHLGGMSLRRRPIQAGADEEEEVQVMGDEVQAD